jgi:hypothetical protein
MKQYIVEVACQRGNRSFNLPNWIYFIFEYREEGGDLEEGLIDKQ